MEQENGRGASALLFYLQLRLSVETEQNMQIHANVFQKGGWTHSWGQSKEPRYHRSISEHMVSFSGEEIFLESLNNVSFPSGRAQKVARRG